MITEQEKEEIIQAATERALLTLPNVISALMESHTKMAQIKKTFFDKHKEFKDYPGIVGPIIERIEGNNTLERYDRILEMAVPEIQKAIRLKGRMNNSLVTSKPNTYLGEL